MAESRGTNSMCKGFEVREVRTSEEERGPMKLKKLTVDFKPY